MQEPGNEARVVSTPVIPAASWGHSKSRNRKWEMRNGKRGNGKRGNGEIEQQCTSGKSVLWRTVECTCCAH